MVIFQFAMWQLTRPGNDDPRLHLVWQLVWHFQSVRPLRWPLRPGAVLVSNSVVTPVISMGFFVGLIWVNPLRTGVIADLLMLGWASIFKCIVLLVQIVKGNKSRGTSHFWGADCFLRQSHIDRDRVIWWFSLAELGILTDYLVGIFTKKLVMFTHKHEFF